LHEKKLYDGLAVSQCCLSYDKTVGFQTRSFTTPPKYDSARTQLEAGESVESLGFWPNTCKGK